MRILRNFDLHMLAAYTEIGNCDIERKLESLEIVSGNEYKLTSSCAEYPIVQIKLTTCGRPGAGHIETRMVTVPTAPTGGF